jgi:predicted small metal-binding protein
MEDAMKELRCSDVGFTCDAVVRADNEDEVLRQGAEHARKAHGIEKFDDATVQRIRSKIRST